MTRQELIAKVAKDTGSSKAGASAAVASMIEGITASLKESRSIATLATARTQVPKAPMAQKAGSERPASGSG